MQQVELKVEGITCMGCVSSLQRLLSTLPGVSEVRIDLASSMVKLNCEPEVLQTQAIQQALEDSGYRVVHFWVRDSV